MCREALTGRCYWEVERRGRVSISVTYRGIKRRGGVSISVTYRGISRRGGREDCRFGRNDQSWSLSCSGGRYSVYHNNTVTHTSSSSSSSSSSSGRVAVYLDHPAGSLSFYRVSSDTLIHLHTIRTTFTEPLYAGSWVQLWFLSVSGSSVGGRVSSCSRDFLPAAQRVQSVQDHS
ncbi:stonustoxin subunit beta-like [Notothenia coriiceps]|uniref:Stonustoxin subunit beta-like n=1 Tax=Notothenia coriiceps TaxID=8208 RepID=A0A6I9P8D4_9TELE|nr:PREDICTED: stonustoxin subunit beta-like [Notothenia coriiceps]